MPNELVTFSQATSSAKTRKSGGVAVAKVAWLTRDAAEIFSIVEKEGEKTIEEKKQREGGQPLPL